MTIVVTVHYGGGGCSDVRVRVVEVLVVVVLAGAYACAWLMELLFRFRDR